MTRASGVCESVPVIAMPVNARIKRPPPLRGGCLAVWLPSAVLLAAVFLHPVPAGLLIPAALPGVVSIIALVRVSTWEARCLTSAAALAFSCAVTWLIELSSLALLPVEAGSGTLAFACGMSVMLFAPVSLRRAVWAASVFGLALACAAVVTRHWEYLARRHDAGGMVLATLQACAGMIFTLCLMTCNTRRARKSMGRINRRRRPSCR